jgi:hypothetical protein
LEHDVDPVGRHGDTHRMPRSFIDLAYSYSDYGWMQTACSQIDVVRGEGSVARFPVEPTRAKLRSQGILMGFRHHF